MNRKEGYGSYKWKNGKRYIGDWVNNMRHGKGCIKYEDGTERESLWDRDRKVGLDSVISKTEYKPQGSNNNILKSI
jgi:radial spoke head protein 1